MQDFAGLMSAQRAFFLRGATRSYAFRVAQLNRLLTALKRYEAEIMAALKEDLGKPDMEAYVGEVGFVYAEIRHALRDLERWMKPKRVGTPLSLQPSSSYVISEPLGQVLIIAPWNYPLQLSVAPLIGAMAAGNCAVVKPSELAPHTAQVVERIIEESFPREYIAVMQGGVEVSQALLACKWDHIFFTGSTPVGRMVAKAAAEHLTPVTLELGGKSPCIVGREVDLDVTARRIVWGKFFNSGQTCVAPDYLLVDAAVKDKLLERMTFHLSRFFGPDPAHSEDYARIINQRHFDRLVGLLGEGRVVVGGQYDREGRYIAPTIIDSPPFTAPVMQEEIFGPILPVLPYSNLEEAIDTVRRFPKPLALYLFSTNASVQQRVTEQLSFGGGCINDAIVHLSNPNLPFGGVGESGMGAYHGKYSFDTFSHRKAIVKNTMAIDPRIRYQPYKGKLNLVRKLLR